MILGTQIILMYPASGDKETPLSPVQQTALLLKQHPNAGFHRVVRAMIHRLKSPYRAVGTTPYEPGAQAMDYNFFELDFVLQEEDRTYEMTTLACPDESRDFQA